MRRKPRRTERPPQTIQRRQQVGDDGERRYVVVRVVTCRVCGLAELVSRSLACVMEDCRRAGWTTSGHVAACPKCVPSPASPAPLAPPRPRQLLFFDD